MKGPLAKLFQDDAVDTIRQSQSAQDALQIRGVPAAATIMDHIVVITNGIRTLIANNYTTDSLSRLEYVPSSPMNEGFSRLLVHSLKLMGWNVEKVGYSFLLTVDKPKSKL